VARQQFVDDLLAGQRADHQGKGAGGGEGEADAEEGAARYQRPKKTAAA
jgi:hypothetical protein